MSIIHDARRGIVTDEMKTVAEQEGVTEDFVRRGIAEGHIVVPVSPYRKVRICGIGEGLRTKVNASIGTSTDIVDIGQELENQFSFLFTKLNVNNTADIVRKYVKPVDVPLKRPAAL